MKGGLVGACNSAAVCMYVHAVAVSLYIKFATVESAYKGGVYVKGGCV